MVKPHLTQKLRNIFENIMCEKTRMLQSKDITANVQGFQKCFQRENFKNETTVANGWFKLKIGAKLREHRFVFKLRVLDFVFSVKHTLYCFGFNFGEPFHCLFQTIALPYANSLDLAEMMSNSASHLIHWSRLTLSQYFHQKLRYFCRLMVHKKDMTIPRVDIFQRGTVIKWHYMFCLVRSGPDLFSCKKNVGCQRQIISL